MVSVQWSVVSGQWSVVSGLVKMILIISSPDGAVFKYLTQTYKPKKEFQTCAMCEFDENEDTMSVYFD